MINDPIVFGVLRLVTRKIAATAHLPYSFKDECFRVFDNEFIIVVETVDNPVGGFFVNQDSYQRQDCCDAIRL